MKLTRWQLVILDYVRSGQTGTAGEIGSAIGLNESTSRKTLVRLEALGFVRRHVVYFNKCGRRHEWRPASMEMTEELDDFPGERISVRAGLPIVANAIACRPFLHRWACGVNHGVQA
jgi:hypothetical protein